MNPPHPSLDVDSRDEDRLDRFLDDLVRGAKEPAHGLDPGLVTSIRHMHAVVDNDGQSAGTRDDRTLQWEEIMRTTTTAPSPRSLWGSEPHADGMPTLRALRRPLSAASFVRAVATMAAILVLMVAATSLYQRVPGQGSTPTVMAAGFEATSSQGDATRTSVSPTMVPPTFGVGEDGTEFVRPSYSACTSERAEYADVMEIVGGDDYPFDQAPPQPQIATVSVGPNGTARYEFARLPDGDPVDEATIRELATVYGGYISCRDVPLHQAAFLSDAGLARFYWEAPGVYLHDGGVDGFRIMMLWADEQGQQRADLEHVGEPSTFFLYGFRLLPDGKIAALVSGAQGNAEDEEPTLSEDAGYVVFVEQDGGWVIDEQLLSGAPAA